jgi:hypothetical protein
MYMCEALATVLSMWSFHAILLSKVTPRYVTLFTKGMSRPFSCSTSSGTLKSSGGTDLLNFPFFYFKFRRSNHEFTAERPRVRVGLTVSRLVLTTISRHGSLRKHRLPVLLYSIVAVELLLSWKHSSLRNHYLAAVVVRIFEYFAVVT